MCVFVCVVTKLQVLPYPEANCEAELERQLFLVDFCFIRMQSLNSVQGFC